MTLPNPPEIWVRAPAEASASPGPWVATKALRHLSTAELSICAARTRPESVSNSPANLGLVLIPLINPGVNLEKGPFGGFKKIISNFLTEELGLMFTEG